jgi:hypothetical protein
MAKCSPNIALRNIRYLRGKKDVYNRNQRVEIRIMN